MFTKLAVLIVVLMCAFQAHSYIVSNPRRSNTCSVMKMIGSPYRSCYTGNSMSEIIRELDNMASKAFIPTATYAGYANSNILMDVKETAKNYVLMLDIPGVKKEDIDLTQKDDILTISAEKNSMQTEEGDTVRRQERVVGKFTRAITLPENVDRDSIIAKYENGVLQLTIPKADVVDKLTKSIEIQ